MNTRLKVAMLLFSVIGFFSFIVLSFVKSVDCSQLVIDTYEMHADINIPDASFINCYFDEDLNLRIAVYDLVESLDLSRFSAIPDQPIGKLLLGANLLGAGEVPTTRNVLLYADGEKWGREWTFLYDQQKDRFWAELRY